LSYAPIF